MHQPVLVLLLLSPPSGTDPIPPLGANIPLPISSVELSLMAFPFGRNRRGNYDPRNFNPNHHFQGNYSNFNRGYRGEGTILIIIINMLT